MNPARVAYTALAYLLLPVALGRLAWRSLDEPGYAGDVPERLGIYSQRTPPGPLIWIHAVSVGETRASEPLVRALQARFPDHAILITHMTPTGRRTEVALFGDAVLRAYLPYDLPPAVARFLDHFRPRFGVIMETEIWPNLVAACRARGVPLLLANARLSERSYRGYRRLGSLGRQSVSALTAIAAQSSDDAQRFGALGAGAITVTGSLKFDVTPPPEQLARGRAWRAAYGGRGIVLAASTREGEEALILDAFAAACADALLVIVPRHPQRFDEVAALLDRRGVTYVRRSGGATIAAQTRVLLGDSMGEMTAYYAAADIAFVGGSLLPFGGQNFIEACAAGVPVLLGPHTYNFADAAERAIAAGAALRIESASELARETGRLLRDEPLRAQMAQRALEFSRAHQGATAKVIAMIEDALSPMGPAKNNNRAR